MKRNRKLLKYRILHWFNNLTANDFFSIGHIVFEFLTAVVLFSVIFIILPLFL